MAEREAPCHQASTGEEDQVPARYVAVVSGSAVEH